MGTISDAVRPLAGKVEVDFVDLHELRKDQVRSRVVVGDALLGDLLNILIKYRPSSKEDAKHKPLDGRKVSDKVGCAHILGLITKDPMEDLRAMHKIRNVFAHEWKADSSNDKLVRLVLGLSTVKGEEEQVTAINLMDFYFEAGRKCRDSILKAINELQAPGETTQWRVRQNQRTKRG